MGCDFKVHSVSCKRADEVDTEHRAALERAAMATFEGLVEGDAEAAAATLHASADNPFTPSVLADLTPWFAAARDVEVTGTLVVVSRLSDPEAEPREVKCGDVAFAGDENAEVRAPLGHGDIGFVRIEFSQGGAPRVAHLRLQHYEGQWRFMDIRVHKLASRGLDTAGWNERAASLEATDPMAAYFGYLVAAGVSGQNGLYASQAHREADLMRTGARVRLLEQLRAGWTLDGQPLEVVDLGITASALDGRPTLIPRIDVALRSPPSDEAIELALQALVTQIGVRSPHTAELFSHVQVRLLARQEVTTTRLVAL